MFLVSENKTRPCGGAGQVWHSTVQRQLPPRPSAGFYLTPPGPLEVSALPSAPPTPRAPSTEQILLNACPEQGPAAVGATHINKTTAPPPGSHIPSSKVALLPYTHTHTHTHTRYYYYQNSNNSSTREKTEQQNFRLRAREGWEEACL